MRACLFFVHWGPLLCISWLAVAAGPAGLAEARASASARHTHTQQKTLPKMKTVATANANTQCRSCTDLQQSQLHSALVQHSVDARDVTFPHLFLLVL